MLDRKVGVVIINNLMNIEQAFTLAKNPIQGEIFSTINNIIKKWSDSNEWDSECKFLETGADDEEENTWLSPKHWRSSGEITDEPAVCYEIDFESENGGDTDQLCLTALCKAGNEVIGFRWSIERDKFPSLKKLVWKDELQNFLYEHQELEEFGFSVKKTKEGSSLFLPFHIDQGALAKAYEDDDIESALTALSEALIKVGESESVLSLLVKNLRNKYPPLAE